MSELTDAQEMYDLYLAAEKKILSGQSYTVGPRTLTRADLKEVVRERKAWKRVLDRLSGTGGMKVTRGVPRDK